MRISRSRADGYAVAAIGLFLVAAVTWAYWGTLQGFAERWALPQYSHGYLVPLFALVLLWLRRDRLHNVTLAPSWWGLLLLASGLGMRLFATHFYITWFDGLSLLPVVAGVVLLAGGWRCLLWAAPAVAFLFFMVPLPFRIEHAMGAPLQRVAAVSSTFVLQTLGYPAIRSGNLITIGDHGLNVVETCSGLRMLFIFFAVSSAVALCVQRSLWQKLVILASAAPIALLVNVLRVTLTGVMFVNFGEKVGNIVFHDLAGWLMMPAALLLLWLELIYLSHVVIETRSAPVSIQKTGSLAGLKHAISQQAAQSSSN